MRRLRGMVNTRALVSELSNLIVPRREIRRKRTCCACAYFHLILIRCSSFRAVTYILFSFKNSSFLVWEFFEKRNLHAGDAYPGWLGHRKGFVNLLKIQRLLDRFIASRFFIKTAVFCVIEFSKNIIFDKIIHSIKCICTNNYFMNLS